MITIEGQPDYVFYPGATFVVEWYKDRAGRMKAKDYYEALPREDQKRLNDIVAYIANSPLGKILPKGLYNEEDAENKIYAFKPRDHRFFNFFTAGRKIIIVNAYRKHSQKLGKKDRRLLETVFEDRKDYIDRVQEGTYYGN